MSWWPYAGEYSALASNIGVLNHKGETPYLSRHGQVCNAVEIPFCALVNFLPTIEGPRVRPADFSAVVKKGLCWAYHCHSGGVWSGDYVCAALQDFLERPGAKPKHARVRRSSRVDLFRNELAFPAIWPIVGFLDM